jgi:hypothetical protein
MFCVFLILGLETLRGQEWGEDCLGYSVRRGMLNVKDQRMLQNDLAWGTFAIQIDSIYYFKMTYDVFSKNRNCQITP